MSSSSMIWSSRGIVPALALVAGIAIGAAGVWAVGYAHKPPPEERSTGSEARSEDNQSLHLAPDAVKNARLGTVTAEPGPLPAKLEVTGKIGLNEDRLARVASRVTGIVREVSARLGQSVKAGDVLLTLDSTEAGNAQLEKQ